MKYKGFCQFISTEKQYFSVLLFYKHVTWRECPGWAEPACTIPFEGQSFILLRKSAAELFSGGGAKPCIICYAGGRSVTLLTCRGVRGCPSNMFCPWLFSFFSDSSSPMVLGPVSCPTQVHYTAVFALRNGKFLKVGGEPPTIPPIL